MGPVILIAVCMSALSVHWAWWILWALWGIIRAGRVVSQIQKGVIERRLDRLERLAGINRRAE